MCLCHQEAARQIVLATVTLWWLGLWGHCPERCLKEVLVLQKAPLGLFIRLCFFLWPAEALHIVNMLLNFIFSFEWAIKLVLTLYSPEGFYRAPYKKWGANPAARAKFLLVHNQLGLHFQGRSNNYRGCFLHYPVFRQHSLDLWGPLGRGCLFLVFNNVNTFSTLCKYITCSLIGAGWISRRNTQTVPGSQLS